MKMTEMAETSLQTQIRTGDGRAIELPTVKSLLLEARYGDRVMGTATGAFWARDQHSHCVLITNRHVVTGLHQSTGQALHRHGGLPDNLVVHFHGSGGETWGWTAVTLPLFRASGEPYWFEHPTLGEAADVVALNVGWASDVARYPYYLDTAHDRIGMVIRPSEPLSVLGFPFGMSSSERFPIWATGFLVQELALITPDIPTFLIDCRTRAGQSGSPVIAFRTSGHRSRKGAA